MNYNEVTDLLSPLINDPENLDYKIEVTFHKSENASTLNGEFKVIFKSNKNRKGEFLIGHTFKLDLDHIRLKLKLKEDEGIKPLPNFNNIDKIKDFAVVIAEKYSEFKDWLYCYNKSGDDYDKITEFIIAKRGAIIGKKFGI